VIPFLRRSAAIRPSPHPEDPRSDAALRGPRGEARRLSWHLALVWLMRMLALIWLGKGLFFWAIILGAGEEIPVFEMRSLGFQAMVVFFAIVDPIVAVGLWMATSWGGVLWLLAVMSFLILSYSFPLGLMPGLPVTIGSLGLILAYLGFSFLASREQDM
jgi:fatty acid desaturase